MNLKRDDWKVRYMKKKNEVKQIAKGSNTKKVTTKDASVAKNKASKVLKEVGKKIVKREPLSINDFPPIVGMMDIGVQKEIDLEAKVWNERLYLKEPYKGGT